MAKKIKSDLPSPTTFIGVICVKPEVLMVEEANELKAKEEERRMHMDKASTEGSSVIEEVV